MGTFFEGLMNLFVLFSLGMMGWVLFRLCNMPVAALLGTIAVIGTLKISGLELPASPFYLIIVVQVMLGINIGTRLTRDKFIQLRSMLIPAALIITWSLSVAFFLGALLAKVTDLDYYTAVLSSSMGGLPEMTIIALSTEAEIDVVIVMHVFRMVITFLVFPFILKFLATDCDRKNIQKVRKPSNYFLKFFQDYFGTLMQKNTIKLTSSLGRGLLTALAGLGGGMLFLYWGVPAGAMVGSMITVASMSFLGLKLVKLPANIYGFLLVGVGIIISDNISSHTITTIVSHNMLNIIIISTVFTFSSSILVSYLIHKTTGWDFITSFLVAAPAGFTTMTILAISYGRDPFKVSTLHLCRLVVLKSFLPLAFMFFLK